MNLRTSILFTLLLSNALTAFGQNLEPLDLAKKIFSKQPFPNIEKYIAGEYEGSPNGNDISSSSIIKFLLLEQTSNKAVVALTILDSNGKGLDTYLHFEKDSIWKMHAFRALAMTGIIEQLKNELEKMTPEQVDEQIEKSKKAKNKQRVLYASREDYNNELGNVRLILELDENIIQHFGENKTAFERLKEIALKELASKTVDDEHTVRLLESLEGEYKKLFITSVSYGDYKLGGKCLNFLIGGMLDNTVGYLYIMDKKDIPQMNAGRIIMLREIGDGWYLYKTT